MVSTSCLKDSAGDVEEEEEEDDAVLLDVEEEEEEEEEEATERSFVAVRDILRENDSSNDSWGFIVIRVISCKNKLKIGQQAERNLSDHLPSPLILDPFNIINLICKKGMSC